MLSGVPKSERWWLWAFFLWIFFSLGPGLLLANKPAFIGYFPVLYVWSLAFWVISLILTYFLGYKLTFTNISDDIEEGKEDVRREA
ncbi:MAG: hypothetical protein JG781_1292 [Peptococcaceae bacterium]|nr:hypothetical protein [Peptococcaceae bacterium]